MRLHPKLLSTPEEITDLAQELSNHAWIALDTEFIREHTFYPKVALIQVATREESWLIDPLPLKFPHLKPFLDVLQNKNIRKILHAAQSDQEVFFSNYEIIATPSFDTAVGASLCGFGESVGLGRLIHEVLGVSIPKGHSRTDWTIRPLPEEMARYAHQDVHYLIPLTERLLERLERTSRVQWAYELSEGFENPELYQANPERLAFRMIKNKNLDRHLNARGYAVLLELVSWRENFARRVDIPRRRVMDDDVILDLVIAKPKDLRHLSSFRGLSKGLLKQSGEELLEAIRRAEKIPTGDLVSVPKADNPVQREERSLELLNCFLKMLADKLSITPKHLVPSESVLKLLRCNARSIDELAALKILTRGALDLIGTEIVDFLNGRVSLSLKGGEVNLK